MLSGPPGQRPTGVRGVVPTLRDRQPTIPLALPARYDSTVGEGLSTPSVHEFGGFWERAWDFGGGRRKPENCVHPKLTGRGILWYKDVMATVAKLQEQITEAWRRRWEQVAFMHDVQKMTFQAIGDDLGFSKARAFALYKKATRNGKAAQ